jgi:hypothetical protein
LTFRNALRQLHVFWLRQRFFVLQLFTYSYFYQGADPNQHSRLFLSLSMLQRHAFDISDRHAFTIDKSFVGEAFYSDKSPGISFLAVPVLWLMQKLDAVVPFSASLPDDWMWRGKLHVVSILLSGLSGVMATVFLDKAMRTMRAGREARRWVVVAYAFGSILFPFSTVLFAHTFVAMLVNAGLVIALQLRLAVSDKKVALFGAVAALSVVSEYPSVLLFLALGLYIVSGIRSLKVAGRALLFASVGALPLLVLHSLYLRAAFGGYLDLPYHHVYELVFRVHHDTGFLGINLPDPAALYGIFLSRYRGMFFLSPFFALTFLGLRTWHKNAELRAEFWLCVASLVLYTCFVSSYYAWDGGGSLGPRHFVPALGYLALPISRLEFSRNLRILATLLSAIGIVSIGLGVVVLVHQSEGEVLLSDPLYQDIVPAFFCGEFALNTQDIMVLGPRSDAAYSAGELFGLSKWVSLLGLLLVWAIAYGRLAVAKFLGTWRAVPVPGRIRMEVS